VDDGSYEDWWHGSNLLWMARKEGADERRRRTYDGRAQGQ